MHSVLFFFFGPAGALVALKNIPRLNDCISLARTPETEGRER